MAIATPIDVLQTATKGCKKYYKESDCAELLEKVDYDVLRANCRYFRAFDRAFAARLPA